MQCKLDKSIIDKKPVYQPEADKFTICFNLLMPCQTGIISGWLISHLPPLNTRDPRLELAEIILYGCTLL